MLPQRRPALPARRAALPPLVLPVLLLRPAPPQVLVLRLGLSLLSAPRKRATLLTMALCSAASPTPIRSLMIVSLPHWAPALLLMTLCSVPIYDARRRTFGLNSAILNNLDGTFPRYPHDPPPGSCCVVGYTTNRYIKLSDKNKEHADCQFGHNPQFVILLAAPDDVESGGGSWRKRH